MRLLRGIACRVSGPVRVIGAVNRWDDVHLNASVRSQ